jgi:hypothetical protein
MAEMRLEIELIACPVLQGDAPTIRTLLDTKALTKDKGDAESWTVCHNEPNEISEMEWSIIYRFSRLPDGSIKLTAIQFIG